MSRLADQIARNLKRARDDADLTQEELARLAHVSTMHISRLERATVEQPRRPELEGIAAALGLTADVLMGLGPEIADDDTAPEPDPESVIAGLAHDREIARLLVAIAQRYGSQSQEQRRFIAELLRMVEKTG